MPDDRRFVPLGPSPRHPGRAAVVRSGSNARCSAWVARLRASSRRRQPALLSERAAKLVGERSKRLRLRRLFALGVLAHFGGFLRLSHRLVADTNTAARRIGFEDDDLNVAADGKRFLDVGALVHAGFTKR